MPSKYPELIFLRHGETVWNVENRMQGWLNSPLTARGIEQAKNQGQLLARLSLSDWNAYSSPSGRALQTAGHAVAPLFARIHTDVRLQEIDVGTWSGRLRSELAIDTCKNGEHAGAFSLYEAAPGGEGFDSLESRCRNFLNDLNGSSVIVTHGITSRMLRTIVLGLDRSELGNLPGGQGNLFHIKDGVQKEIV